MSPVHLRSIGVPRNQKEERTENFRIPVQRKPQSRGLERHGTSSPAPPTPPRPVTMENGKQEVQPQITLGRTWKKFPEYISQNDNFQGPHGNKKRVEPKQELQTPGGKGSQYKGKSSHYPKYRRTMEPESAYFNSLMLTRSGKPNQLPNDFTPLRIQQISGKEKPFFSILGIFQEKARIKRKEQDFFQPEAERVRPNYIEVVRASDIITLEKEIFVNTHEKKITIPTIKNDIPTQNEQIVAAPESA
ncbi:hypothetical protein O181_106353 [Austropuccinia psidii MF-1]|uniref:Uncharacterized protein n=1 Tax=Austropuccinia psidii MF-1 TaxID=1389203 RepID=A0A9Q3JQM7_9BASI|nr:hypothetical protein [Austropuccinia psidii MF-1]